MAKAKATANTAATVLAKMLGVVVENASAADIAAILKEAGLTVVGGKVVKAEKGGKAAKGKKAKAPTVAEIVAAAKDEEELDISGVSEDDLRAAVVKAKLSTAKKAKALDEDDLRELLNEAMGVESEDDEDEDDEDELDLDSLDKKELLALVLEHKLAPAKKAKKMDEDELRELCEEHFGGEDDEDEEDEDDEDFDDSDEDEDDE